MSCVCCFFDNEHQKQLKEQCFSEPSFKEKLIMYKKLYIDEFKTLNSLKNCSCDYSKKYINEPTYLQFCDDLLDDYKMKIDLLEKLFDGLIEIYATYIEGNRSDAYKKLDTYINKYCTNYSSDNAMQFCTILFRGRPTGNMISEAYTSIIIYHLVKEIWQATKGLVLKEIPCYIWQDLYQLRFKSWGKI